ncbi:unnamed protein product [Lymnaea stagnalis]|uniref:C2H2-type domain-containing protein n=1 Tax=Lymnaea stagnalis TaxID=6523 RepID=A0AAV2I738_LYMST
MDKDLVSKSVFTEVGVDDFIVRLEKAAAIFLELLQESQYFHTPLSSISLVCKVIKFIHADNNLKEFWLKQEYFGINPTQDDKQSKTGSELSTNTASEKSATENYTNNNNLPQNIGAFVRTTRSSKSRNINASISENSSHSFDSNYKNDGPKTPNVYNQCVAQVEENTSNQVIDFQCTYCNKRFIDRRNLKSHLWLHEREKSFKCDQCNKMFLRPHQLTRHKRVHTGEKPYPCAICGKHFTDVSNLNRHKRREHPNDASYLRCEECGKESESKSDLQLHLKEHRKEVTAFNEENDSSLINERMGQERTAKNMQNFGRKSPTKKQRDKEAYLCQICGKALNKRAALLAHMKRHISKKDFRCEFCNKVYTELQELKVHRQEHTGERPFKCNQCGKGFKSRGTLRSHLAVHSGEQPYSCDVCGKCFSQTSGLNLHKLKHTAEEERTHGSLDTSQYNCDICGRCYKTKFRLQLHIKSHDSSRDVSCDFCDKKFQSAQDLGIHRRSHTKDKYSCRVCGASFKSRSVYYFHTRTHKIERPHMCTSCGKCFVSATDLNTHKRRHKANHDDKYQSDHSFICKLCGRIYKMKNSLIIHMKIHQGIFDHPCDFCEKKFKSHAELRHHRRTHTLEKPYMCETCNRSFSRHSTLVNHRRTHSGERPYLCMSCGAAFKLSCTLKKHAKIHAREAVSGKGRPEPGRTRGPRKTTAKTVTLETLTTLEQQPQHQLADEKPQDHHHQEQRLISLHPTYQHTAIVLPQVLPKPPPIVLELREPTHFIQELKPMVANIVHQEDNPNYIQDGTVGHILDTRNTGQQTLLPQSIRVLAPEEMEDREPRGHMTDLRNSISNPVQINSGNNTFTAYYYY